MAPRSTAQHLLTPEALQQEAEALQRAEDEEHQRITNIRVVGFMIKRAQDGVEETAVPASSLAAQPGVTDIADSRDSSVSNGVAQANQIVATVNIELAGEVVRLEAEIAQLHERCAILQTNNKALESRITAMAPQKERTNTIDFMSTGTNEQVDKDECECAEKEQ